MKSSRSKEVSVPHNGAHMAHCEWPGCDAFATVGVRTLHVPRLYLCGIHRKRWHTLHYLQMVDVSANRGSRRIVRSKRGPGVYSSYGVETVGVRNHAGLVNK